jgi:hypothetical protein
MNNHQHPLSSRATAEALNTSVPTVRRLIRRGILNRVRGLGRIRVTPTEIARFLDEETK